MVLVSPELGTATVQRSSNGGSGEQDPACACRFFKKQITTHFDPVTGQGTLTQIRAEFGGGKPKRAAEIGARKHDGPVAVKPRPRWAGPPTLNPGQTREHESLSVPVICASWHRNWPAISAPDSRTAPKATNPPSSNTATLVFSSSAIRALPYPLAPKCAPRHVNDPVISAPAKRTAPAASKATPARLRSRFMLPPARTPSNSSEFPGPINPYTGSVATYLPADVRACKPYCSMRTELLAEVKRSADPDARCIQRHPVLIDTEASILADELPADLRPQHHDSPITYEATVQVNRQTHIHSRALSECPFASAPTRTSEHSNAPPIRAPEITTGPAKCEPEKLMFPATVRESPENPASLQLRKASNGIVAKLAITGCESSRSQSVSTSGQRAMTASRSRTTADPHTVQLHTFRVDQPLIGGQQVTQNLRSDGNITPLRAPTTRLSCQLNVSAVKYLSARSGFQHQLLCLSHGSPGRHDPSDTVIHRLSHPPAFQPTKPRA